MLSEEEILNLLIDNLTWFITEEGTIEPLYELQVKKAAHAIHERMRERVAFEGKVQLTYLYPSGKCAIFESKEVSLEIMDSTSNEEPPSHKWLAKGWYRLYVVKEEA